MPIPFVPTRILLATLCAGLPIAICCERELIAMRCWNDCSAIRTRKYRVLPNGWGRHRGLNPRCTRSRSAENWWPGSSTQANRCIPVEVKYLMQNAAPPRIIFRKEAILRHIKREDSSVLPSFERRGELAGLWLTITALLCCCIALTTIPSKCTVSATVVKSARAPGLCLAVPDSGRQLLRPSIPVALSWTREFAPMPATISADQECSVPMNHDSSQTENLVALYVSVPPRSQQQANALEPGTRVDLTAQIRIWDLVRNGLSSRRGDRE